MADSPAQPKSIPNEEQAIAHYVAMRPVQLRRLLADRYQRAAGLPPTRCLETIKSWSARFCWQDRRTDDPTLTADMSRQTSQPDAKTFPSSPTAFHRQMPPKSLIAPDLAVRIRGSLRQLKTRHRLSVDINVDPMRQAERSAAEIDITAAVLTVQPETTSAHAWKASR
jgi:hypothetical protein